MSEAAPAKTLEIPQRETLRSFLKEKLEQGQLEEAIEGVLALFQAQEEDKARLLREFKQSLRQRFGRKSERIPADQLDLALDALAEAALEAAADAAAAEIGQPALTVDEGQPRAAAPSDASTDKPKRRPRRKPLPAHLPREEVVVPVAADEVSCPICHDARQLIGHEESEVLDFIPASFRVRRIRRERRACRCWEGGVATAPPLPKIVEKGLLGEGLLAQVVVAKFRDHVPLYRQRQIAKRAGVDLPTSTLGDAVAEVAGALEPIARRLKERALKAVVLLSDDTGLRVLDRDHPQGAKRGYLWAHVGDSRDAFFHYTPTREAKGPQSLLEHRRGYLVVDGHNGYQALFTRTHEPCIEVACWAHTRRYFVRAFEAGDEEAAKPLALIQELYRVECEAKERSLDFAARQQLRELRARPLVQKLEAWLDEKAPRAAPKSPLGQAIAYTRKRWPALQRYLDDGRLPVDTNEVERLIRIVALGRKNFLFAGSDAGAERAAILYTVLVSCALHEIEPWAYVKDVLEKLAAGWPNRRLDALLPDAWAAEHPHAVSCIRPA